MSSSRDDHQREGGGGGSPGREGGHHHLRVDGLLPVLRVYAEHRHLRQRQVAGRSMSVDLLQCMLLSFLEPAPTHLCIQKLWDFVDLTWYQVGLRDLGE